MAGDEGVDKVQNGESVDDGQPEEVAADQDMAEEVAEVDELTRVSQENEELQNKLLLLAADFDNYKKRMERDRGLALKYAEENILKELLPAIDNLERALDQGREVQNTEDLLAGVEMTYKGIMTALAKFEVVALESVGFPFDPNQHEALTVQESDEAEPNSVMAEFEKGYVYKDRLIRPAKVVVAKQVEGNKE